MSQVSLGAGMEPLTEPFYSALQRGELALQHCKNCDRNILYPRHRCPFCHGTELDWVQSSGKGTLHSFAVHRVAPPSGFEFDVPYAVAVVKLDDGVQLLGRLWADDDGDWSGYDCDCRVEFAPATSDEVANRPVAWFRRAR